MAGKGGVSYIMEDYEKIAFELAEIANELWAREASNNCPNVDLRGISWDELCKSQGCL